MTPTAAQLQEAHAIIHRVGVSTEDVIARVAHFIADADHWRAKGEELVIAREMNALLHESHDALAKDKARVDVLANLLADALDGFWSTGQNLGASHPHFAQYYWFPESAWAKLKEALKAAKAEYPLNHAPAAAQRCEALLRTLNLWKDTP